MKRIKAFNENTDEYIDTLSEEAKNKIKNLYNLL